MSQLSATAIRQMFLMLLIAAIFVVIFWNLYFFVPALLGAYAFYVLLRFPLFFLTERWKWPNKLAVAVLVLGSFVVVLLPFNWLFGMLQGRVVALFQNSESLMQNAAKVLKTLEDRYHVTLLTPENIKSISDWAVHSAQSLLGATVNGVGILLSLYFILWFMLAEGKKMEASFFAWLPLRPGSLAYVKKHLNDMVWGNALGIPLMGVVQGCAGLLIYWLAGIQDPWLWFAITFVAGMMPVAGAALAYVPLSLILLSEGENGKALLILLYGIIVVGSVDNIARMWLMNKISQTHPLITLFGVIAGLQMFGFIGFIFGPILIEMFILLLRIYHKEFAQVH